MVFLCVLLGTALLCGLGVRDTRAQFPRVCASNTTREDSTCCPVPLGASEPCGGPGRGSCHTIPGDLTALDRAPKALLHDPRLQWPTRYFQRACSCEGNYMGYMCQDCKFGNEGDDCMSKKGTAVRKNAMSLTPGEREKWVNAMVKMKGTPSDYVVLKKGFGVDGQPMDFVNVSVYDYYNYIHFFAVKTTEVDGKPYCPGPREKFDFAHGGSGFLSWHRLLLLFFERDFQRASGDPSFGLPYWNWSGKGSDCAVCTNDIAGSTNSSDPRSTLQRSSPFSEWQVTCPPSYKLTNGCPIYNCDMGRKQGPLFRRPAGNEVKVLPDMQQVRHTLRTKVFDLEPFDGMAPIESFRNCLEGSAGPLGRKEETGQSTMHSQTHFFFAGPMGQIHNPTDDPLFYMHHGYVDKLFEVWLRMQDGQLQYPPQGSAPVGSNLGDAMVPFFPVYRHLDWLGDLRDHGVDFDNMEEITWVEGQGNLEPESSSSSEYLGWQGIAALTAGAVLCLGLVAAFIITAYKKGKRGPRTEEQQTLLHT